MKIVLFSFVSLAVSIESSWGLQKREKLKAASSYYFLFFFVAKGKFSRQSRGDRTIAD